MRFLILQDIPEGTAQEKFSIAKCFERALNRSGFFAESLNTVSFKSILGNYDVLLITQNYFLDNIEYVKDFKGLKIFWSIDSHKDLNRHKKFISDCGIDITLVSGFNYVNKFNDAFWFPNCYPADLIKPIDFKNRINKIGFCGSKSNRGDWLTDLSLFTNFHLAINETAEKMVNNLLSYEIGWNRNESDDLNFRNFETTGAGAMLLTNNIGGIELCFDQDEVVIYTTIEECKDKITYYSSHDADRQKIALNGYVKARTMHTFDSRVSQLIRIINTGRGLL